METNSHSLRCLDFTERASDQLAGCLDAPKGWVSIEAQSASQCCLPVPGTGGEGLLQRVRTGPWTRRRYTLRRKEIQVSPRMCTGPGSGQGCFETATVDLTSQPDGYCVVFLLADTLIRCQTMERLCFAIYWCMLTCWRPAMPPATVTLHLKASSRNTNTYGSFFYRVWVFCFDKRRAANGRVVITFWWKRWSECLQSVSLFHPESLGVNSDSIKKHGLSGTRTSFLREQWNETRSWDGFIEARLYKVAD